VKLTNLKIAPKLGILLGITLVGLSAAGILAGYLVQHEMLDARIERVHAIVDMARNMAAGLQKEVEAGKLTKEAALAEFGKRANTLTYDNGSGYLFGNTMEGITVLAPDPSFIGKNRLDVLTNGRAVSRELLNGVAAKGEITSITTTSAPARKTPAARLATPPRCRSSTCMSAPASISTMSTPS
jgi:methyl-accepting chemotaxis protein